MDQDHLVAVEQRLNAVVTHGDGKVCTPRLLHIAFERGVAVGIEKAAGARGCRYIVEPEMPCRGGGQGCRDIGGSMFRLQVL